MRSILITFMLMLFAGCAIIETNPTTPRKMNGSWCSLGTSITWYNDHVEVAHGLFTRGYQSRVMEVLSFDGFVNPAINGGTIVRQAEANVPKASYYTIEHGINDWGFSTPIGTIDEYRSCAVTNTFYASYRKLIDKIRAVNPEATIILCTPRRGYGFGSYLPATSDAPKNGIRLCEYVDAVRAIAAEENFVIADFYATCGEDAELKSLSIDVALHPNDTGYQLMALEVLRAFSRVK